MRKHCFHCRPLPRFATYHGQDKSLDIVWYPGHPLRFSIVVVFFEDPLRQPAKSRFACQLVGQLSKQPHVDAEVMRFAFKHFWCFHNLIKSGERLENFLTRLECKRKVETAEFIDFELVGSCGDALVFCAYSHAHYVCINSAMHDTTLVHLVDDASYLADCLLSHVLFATLGIADAHHTC